MNEGAHGAPPREWKCADGTVLACAEKVRILSENWEEAKTLLQEILDDAVLMGCTVSQVKKEYKRLIDEIECPYQERGGDPGNSVGVGSPDD